MKLHVSRTDLVEALATGIASSLHAIGVVPPTSVAGVHPADARHMFATARARLIAAEIAERFDVEGMEGC